MRAAVGSFLSLFHLFQVCLLLFAGSLYVICTYCYCVIVIAAVFIKGVVFFVLIVAVFAFIIVVVCTVWLYRDAYRLSFIFFAFVNRFCACVYAKVISYALHICILFFE